MWSRNRGLTLVELVIVIAVSAILLAAAAPSLRNVVRNNRLVAVINALSGSLAVARSEAVTRSKRVVVCKSHNGSECTSSGNWEQGWLVFEDLDGAGECTDADDDKHCDEHGGVIIRARFEPSPADLSLRGSGNLNYKVAFNPQGFATGYAGTFTACDDRGEDFARGLVLSRIGRVRVADWDIDSPKCEEP